jgi:predicted Zn finger-like uncharacterized protein
MTVHFNCPNCNALYRVVKAETGPEAIIDREITCWVCGGPIAARDGKFVLKYFLLWKVWRRQEKSAVTRRVSPAGCDLRALRPDEMRL